MRAEAEVAATVVGAGKGKGTGVGVITKMVPMLAKQVATLEATAPQTKATLEPRSMPAVVVAHIAALADGTGSEEIATAMRQGSGSNRREARHRDARRRGGHRPGVHGVIMGRLPSPLQRG